MNAVNPTGHRSKCGISFWLGLLMGWAVIAYAIAGIIREKEGTNPPGLLRWVVTLAVAHDLLLAPLVAIVGGLLAWVLPRRARGPVLAAFALSATLTLFAWPNVRGYGRRALNNSTLPWDYGRNLLEIVAVIWISAAAVIAYRVLHDRRHPMTAGSAPEAITETDGSNR